MIMSSSVSVETHVIHTIHDTKRPVDKIRDDACLVDELSRSIIYMVSIQVAYISR